jgi:hypothetical protein
MIGCVAGPAYDSLLKPFWGQSDGPRVDEKALSGVRPAGPPTKPETDGDGFSDGDELPTLNTEPTKPGPERPAWVYACSIAY